MSDLNKTMHAALAELLRPRRMARVRRTIARTRADGAWFDAVLWSAFSVVVVASLLFVVHGLEASALGAWGLDKDWLVATAVLVAIFGAGFLWWRWFKWHVHAADLSRGEPGSSQLPGQQTGAGR